MSSGHPLTCPVDTLTMLAGHICVFARAQHSKMCSLNTVMSVSEENIETIDFVITPLPTKRSITDVLMTPEDHFTLPKMLANSRRMCSNIMQL